MSDALDPFGEFESAAEIAGFVYKKFGAAGLRQCLSMTTEGSTTVLTAEFLERAANELAEVGLAKAAAVVAEIADTMPSELDLCPYAPDSANGRSWLANRRRTPR
jgi:hypothetical protein